MKVLRVDFPRGASSSTELARLHVCANSTVGWYWGGLLCLPPSFSMQNTPSCVSIDSLDSALKLTLLGMSLRSWAQRALSVAGGTLLISSSGGGSMSPISVRATVSKKKPKNSRKSSRPSIAQTERAPCS